MKINFAAVQFDIVWEDKPANHQKIDLLLDDADIQPGTFVVLPELSDTGFSFNLDTIVDDLTLPWAQKTAAERNIFLQVGYAIRSDDGRGRNCATIVAPDGSLLGTYQKVFPFSFGKTREIDYYTGGEILLIEKIKEDANVCPLICYDLRFPELYRLATQAGTEVFTIGANFPAARKEHWRTLNIARSIENQAFVIACNRIGDDPSLSFAGGSMIISPLGEIIAEADESECIIQAELDLDELRAWRTRFPTLNDIKPELLGTIDVERTSNAVIS